MSDDKNLKETSKEVKNPVVGSSEDTSVDKIALEELVEKKADQFSTPHDDFDWVLGNGLASPYSDEEKAKYLKEYEATLTSVLENEIVRGKVSSINSGDVVLDINYKSDGLLSLSEFRDMPDLAIGDMVEVYVEQQEDMRGQLILSRRKAKLLRAWESIVDSYKNGTIIKGNVVSKTKGEYVGR